MGNIDKEVFICVDCETTGLDPKKDRIIEVAAIRFTTSEILAEYESLVDPECTIPEDSIAIHHITNKMVQGKPLIQNVLPALIEFIGDHIIVGHGIGFDIDVITHAAELHHIPCNIHKNRFLDTLRLARLYGESPTNSLKQLARHFNVPLDDAHRAMSDVKANREVFDHLVKRYKTTKQLFDVLAKPIRLKNMPLGKHKGRAMTEIPLEYLLWAARKDFDQDLLFSIRSEIKRRQKGNQFSQATNPFSQL